jgi:hypothetical protein
MGLSRKPCGKTPDFRGKPLSIVENSILQQG